MRLINLTAFGKVPVSFGRYSVLIGLENKPSKELKMVGWADRNKGTKEHYGYRKEILLDPSDSIRYSYATQMRGSASLWERPLKVRNMQQRDFEMGFESTSSNSSSNRTRTIRESIF